MTSSHSEPDHLTKVDRKGLAVYLWLRGFRPESVSWVNWRATWWFHPSEDLDHHIRMHNDRKVVVEPNEYFHALTQLNIWSKEDRNVRQL